MTNKEIEKHLLILKDAELAEKLISFNKIKDVELSKLNKCWKKVRSLSPEHKGELDCLNRVEVILDKPIVLDKVIVTVVSPGYEQYLFMMLRGLQKIGNEIPVVIFAINESFEVFQNTTNTIVVKCISREQVNAAVKGVIYSCSKWVHAKHIISLESDTLPIKKLDELWELLEVVPTDTLCACRPQIHKKGIRTINEIINQERKEEITLPWLEDEKFLINGGVIAGNYEGWKQLEEKIKLLGAWAYIFVEGGMRPGYRDEMIVNWAINYSNNYIQLHPKWNVAFYNNDESEWVERVNTNGKITFYSHGEEAKILHFIAFTRMGPDSIMRRIYATLKENGY